MSFPIETPKTWKITSPGGGLNNGDVLEFVGTQIKVITQGNLPWGSYAPSGSGYSAQTLSGTYYLEYTDNAFPTKDVLTCTPDGLAFAKASGGGQTYAGASARSRRVELLSSILGGLVGVIVGVAVSRFLDVSPGDAFVIASGTALATGINTKLLSYNLVSEVPPGPGGSSWIAEEGG